MSVIIFFILLKDSIHHPEFLKKIFGNHTVNLLHKLVFVRLFENRVSHDSETIQFVLI